MLQSRTSFFLGILLEFILNVFMFVVAVRGRTERLLPAPALSMSPSSFERERELVL